MHFKNIYMDSKKIIKSIILERNRQDIKWGVQNHNIYKWLAILSEEVGEVSKSALEGHLDDVKEELVQVAAVSVAIIESLVRNSE